MTSPAGCALYGSDDSQAAAESVREKFGGIRGGGRADAESVEKDCEKRGRDEQTRQWEGDEVGEDEVFGKCPEAQPGERPGCRLTGNGDGGAVPNPPERGAACPVGRPEIAQDGIYLGDACDGEVGQLETDRAYGLGVEADLNHECPAERVPEAGRASEDDRTLP